MKKVFLVACLSTICMFAMSQEALWKSVAVVLDGESDRLRRAVDNGIRNSVDAGDVHGERLAVVAA